MKTNFRSLLLFFSTAVAAASSFLISSLHATTTQAPDNAEQQAVMAPITQMFDGMEKRDAAAMKLNTWLRRAANEQAALEGALTRACESEKDERSGS